MRRIGVRGAASTSVLRSTRDKSSSVAIRKLAAAAAPRGTIRAFSEVLDGTNEVGRIIDELAGFARGTWGWSAPMIMRHDASRGGYVEQHSSDGAFFAATHPLIHTLLQRSSTITVEELEGSEHADERQAASECREVGWDVCVPIVMDGSVHAFLAFRCVQPPAVSMGDLETLDALAALAGSAMARVRMRNDLAVSESAIRRAERLSSLGTLSASVAHEIRNQMVAIQTFLQLLPERLNDQEFLTSFLSLTNDEVKRITTLVNELLASARSSDRGACRESMNHLVERSITILHPEAKKRQVSLVQDLASDLPEVFINGDKIKQVLTNLILNALQATPPGGNVSIVTRVRRMGEVERLQVEVRDSGCGISAEHLAQVFAPFFTTKPDGTGLGLAIARSIVREHDGEIYAESNDGQGAAFIIELPAAS